jgi:hypothetical protein
MVSIIITKGDKMCKSIGCNNPAVGKSSYCGVHKKEAYKAWKAMIEKAAEEKAERDVKFQELWESGIVAGCKSVASAVDKGADTTVTYGVVWVKVSPGNCQFANWLKKNGYATKSEGSGVKISINHNNCGHAYLLRCAYAEGMAKAFRDAEIVAYEGSFLD